MKSLIIEDSWILCHHKPPSDTTGYVNSSEAWLSIPGETNWEAENLKEQSK